MSSFKSGTNIGSGRHTENPRRVFIGRLSTYASHNFLPTFHYNKVYKPEYLPSRIRYNYLFGFLIFGTWLVITRHNRKSFTNEWRDYENRNYYTTNYEWTNFMSRNAQYKSVSEEVKKQQYIF